MAGIRVSAKHTTHDSGYREGIIVRGHICFVIISSSFFESVVTSHAFFRDIQG
jgi:hypothetical protein